MELRSTVDGKIYLIGGRNASAKTSTKCFALIHPPVNGVPKPICQRQGMESNLFGLRIEFGRLVALMAYNKVESYDPTTDTWQAEASLTTVRAWPVAWVANGRIYAGGGKDGSSLNSIEVYDPAPSNGQVRATSLKTNMQRMRLC